MSHKKSREVMFADETTVISSGIQSDRLTSQDLLNVTKCSCKLTINIDKMSEYITILNEKLIYKKVLQVSRYTAGQVKLFA